MPLEENLYIVPHLKALISGQKFWGGQKCGSTLSLCIAHVKSSVTTRVAKPVVSKGRKEPAVAHQSQYCVDCATGPDGNTIGTENKYFNDPGAYTS